MTVADQPMPSNESYAMTVKERYANKVANYEEILKQERAEEHSNRNRAHRKKFAQEGRKQKKRCAKKAATPKPPTTQVKISNGEDPKDMPSTQLPITSTINQEVDNHLQSSPQANQIAKELIQQIEKKWPETKAEVETSIIEGEETVWLQLDSDEEANANAFDSN